MLDTRLLIQGNSGAGKSWLMRLIAEQTAGKVPTFILDPEGEYATLREKLDMVLVGSEGEIAADPRGAGLLARKLMELRVSAVIDLYELKLGARREFVRDFLDALLNLPKDLYKSPVLVGIDEAHLYCPEKSAGESVATESVIALMSQGRKRGLCGALLTQRLSKLHKDAAAECNNVLIGRTWLDVDQKRAADVLGISERQILRDLSKGEFLAFGPALSVTGVVRFASAAVTTTHPQAGQRHKIEAPAPSAAIQAVLPQLLDLPQKAAAEARTVADLQAEAKTLRRELAAAKKATPTVAPAPAPKTVEKLILKDVQVLRLNADVERLHKLANVLHVEADKITAHGNEIIAALRAASTESPRPRALAGGGGPGAAEMRVAARPHRPAPVVPRTPRAIGDTRISAPQQAILDAVAYFESVGVASPSRRQVALVAMASATSSGFERNLSTLRTAQFIDYPAPSALGLTDAGRGAAVVPETPPTQGELHAAIFGRVSNPQAAMLRRLIADYPESVGRDDLARDTNQSDSSSGFERNMSTLRSLGLITYPTKGTAAAADVLFLEGR